MAKKTLPWARQPKEGDVSWSHFEAYLYMDPPRNITALAKVRGISRSTIMKYSARWKWQDRAIAFDGQRSEALAAATIGMAAEVKHAHLELIRQARELIGARIR